MLNPFKQKAIFETKDDGVFAEAQQRLADAGIAAYTWSHDELPMMSCCGGADARKFGRKDGRLLTVHRIAVRREDAERAETLLKTLRTP